MDDVRARLFRLIDATPNLDWLLLTKRPENINRMSPAYFPGDYIAEAGTMNQEGPRPNVWHLASVEDQSTADARIPELLRVPSVLLGLSMEPLLETVQFRQTFAGGGYRDFFTGQFHHMPAKGVDGNPDFLFSTIAPHLPKLGWIIVGGESGRKARPTNIEAIRGVVKQCEAAGTPVFVKQLGARPWGAGLADNVPGAHIKMTLPVTDDGLRVLAECLDAMMMTLSDPKGGSPDEWPADLRVRQFPTPQEFPV